MMLSLLSSCIMEEHNHAVHELFQDDPRRGQDVPVLRSAVEEGLTAERQQALNEALVQLPPEVRDKLWEALDNSREARAKGLTVDEFVNRVMSGKCPKCGGEETGTCEDDIELGDACVSRCYKCGQLWCTMCRHPLEQNAPSCECWDEEDDCGMRKRKPKGRTGRYRVASLTIPRIPWR